MVKLMKKNMKYRSSNNNYNNQVYSLNYKFDSISPAGKISGTALDLIKRYNELAKEAQGSANYIEAENFRQYAEHYRKIVTEINERKNLRFAQQAASEASASIEPQTTAENPTPMPAAPQPVFAETISPAAEPVSKRAFKIIEINPADAEKPISRVGRPRGRPARKPDIEPEAIVTA